MNLLGFPEEYEPRTVFTNVATRPRSDVGEPAPSADPAGAPAGTASSILVGGVPSGAEVMPVTASEPFR